MEYASYHKNRLYATWISSEGDRFVSAHAQVIERQTIVIFESDADILDILDRAGKVAHHADGRDHADHALRQHHVHRL